MPNLDKIKDKTLDNAVAQLKTWASGGDDAAIKEFLSKNTQVNYLDKKKLKENFSEFMDSGDKAESAADDLENLMQEEEKVAYMMFGTPSGGLEEAIPENVRGRRMVMNRAMTYLEGWRLGAKKNEPTCELMCWTNHRIIWNKVEQDGKSVIHSVPSFPPKDEDGFPELP